MIYCEKLRWIQLLLLLVTRKRAFYGSKSIATRGIERLFEKINIKADTAKIDFGDLQAAPNIRRNAYQEAELYLGKIKGAQWAEEVRGLLAIDFQLIVKKFFFDELYLKYEFLELSLRHAFENPNDSHLIYVEQQFSEPYRDRLEKTFKVCNGRSFEPLYVFSIFLLPVFLRYFWGRNRVAGNLHFINKIICQVDGEKTYEMFSSIFKSCPSVRFVIEKRSASEFNAERLKELHISILGLTKDSYRDLCDAAYKYISCCFRHFREVSMYGSRLFRIFYVLILGKTEAIQGAGNVFVAYEHLITVKAARNEFLRSGGNRSVFVPMNAHATQRYFHSEIFINYDVMCSAGRHVEDLYKSKKSLTSVFLPTGSYENHRGSVKLVGKAERVARLKAFKGDSTALTIVSPGICDPTYSQEVRLIRLACALSKQKGVKVFVRLKPVPPSPKYTDFYDVHTAGCDSILLTSSEYELLDFLEVTDLFVTSISNAACDLALCGGQVVFVDYMETPDMFLYWSVINEVVVTGEESFDVVMEWVHDNEGRRARAELKGKMNKLTAYLGYQFSDFESYRTNLLMQLEGQGCLIR